jgi:hypothetical protein
MTRAWHSVRWIVVRVAVCAVALNVITLVGPTPAKPSTGVNEQTIALSGMRLGEVRQINASIDAEMVGLSWRGDEPATFSVRALDHGTWTDWLQLEGSLSEKPDSGPTRPQTSAGPAWIASNVRLFDVRLDEGAPDDVQLHALDVERPSDSGTGGTALGMPVADAQAPTPFIASRAMWGADEGFRNMYPECTTPDYAPTVDFAVIHHTVNSNNYGPDDVPARRSLRSRLGGQVRWRAPRCHRRARRWLQRGQYRHLGDRRLRRRSGAARGVWRVA